MRAAPDLVELSRAYQLVEPGVFQLDDMKTVVPGGDEALQRALTESIYRQHYCRPSSGTITASFAAQTDLVAAYARANTGRGTLDPGWSWIRQEPDGRVVVEKHGVRFWMQPDHVELHDAGGSFAPGESILVAVPGEIRGLLQGFYVFAGDEPDRRPVAGDSITARFYWHVTERGAVKFVDTVSQVLNEAKIPFRAKILDEPSTFLRADAAVLYIARERIAETLPLLRAIYSDIRTYLRGSVPMFTLRLAPGLSAADDPGDFTSFGQHRCMVAARGLVASYTNQPPTVHERLASLSNAYRAAGLCPRRTYLRSIDAKPYPRFNRRSWFDDFSVNG